jgi:hypothetical protein
MGEGNWTEWRRVLFLVFLFGHGLGGIGLYICYFWWWGSIRCLYVYPILVDIGGLS